MKPKVIAVDLDGTLCKGSCWTVQQCLEAIPRLDVIEKVNELSLYNFIVIYTARRDNLTEVSIRWLRLNEVKFHAYSNNKMPCDYYIDDRVVDVEDFLAGKKLHITGGDNA